MLYSAAMSVHAVMCKIREAPYILLTEHPLVKSLSFADVLLVNMWAKDVGREAGAGKPLLKTIFQARPSRCIRFLA
jgi:hypothetical protein